jgi:iron complex outermembrane receptor protein
MYLGVRGFGLPGDFSTRVLVTLDGNRINNPGYDGGPVGREFPVDIGLIERIEFIPGPGGAVYGQNAMFAVVNVVTRRGADVGGAELTAAYEAPQVRREGRASWGQVLDSGLDLLLSVSGMRARGEDRAYDFGAAGVSGVAAGMDGERDRKFLAHIGAGRWTFQWALSDRHKDDPTGGYHSDPLVAGQYQADRYSLAQLQYQDRLAGDSLSVSARVFTGQERYTSILSYGTPLLFLQPSDWRGIELRLVSTALAGHKLMLGLEAQDNLRNGQSVLDLATPANDLHIPGSGTRVGLYAQDEWRLADALTATLGLRLDRSSGNSTNASPRAALIWQADEATTFKALYGRAHRAPDFFERDYYDGVSQVANPALRAETIDTLEFFADHRVTRDLTLRASIYQWTMKDLVTQGTDPASGLLQFQSGPGVKARGLELSADRTWTTGARLRGNVSVQSAAYASGAGLPNSPRLLGKVNLSSPLPLAGLRLGYELRYDGRRLTPGGSWLAGYAVSNLYLSTEALAPGLELALGFNNLLDRRYAQPGSNGNWQNAIEQDGRSVRVALTQKF